ncbi:alpha/beta fold hydrolase [Rugosimonospora africana]|uniref:Hydrolase n=1 Tax=Rugosimonospora africana TaxID=556532 RepID=A0A8J3R1R0_9ACTN|nr:alpha/beta hydrolase [Rugosimonospora africana]GIH20626.1 hydrolase [Rugosimonospora africana]
MTDLFCIDTGAGQPLVLLHGGFLDHHMWDDQIPAFAPHRRVIAPDARGHGRSPNAEAPFRSADDLAGLLGHLDTGPAVLVGVSLGASTAVDTALEHPELVSAVVVTGSGISDTGSTEPHFNDPWTARTWSTWASAIAIGDLDVSVETLLLFAAGPHRTLDDLDPQVLDRLRTATRGTMVKHHAGETDWRVPLASTLERAATIDVPVLAISGTLDSPDHIEMAELLASTVVNGHAVSIDGTAHYPNLERPDVYNKLLTDFLTAL